MSAWKPKPRNAPLFQHLVPLAPVQLRTAAEGLRNGDPVALLVDALGVYLLVAADKEKPFEVDFVCVRLVNDAWVPCEMTASEQKVLAAWAQSVVPSICKTWKDMPEN